MYENICMFCFPLRTIWNEVMIYNRRLKILFVVLQMEWNWNWWDTSGTVLLRYHAKFVHLLDEKYTGYHK
jgi:hypothetical protein